MFENRTIGIGGDMDDALQPTTCIRLVRIRSAPYFGARNHGEPRDQIEGDGIRR